MFKESWALNPLQTSHPYLIQGTFLSEEESIYFRDHKGQSVRLLGTPSTQDHFKTEEQSPHSPMWVCLFAHPLFRSDQCMELQWSLGGILEPY